MNELEEIDGWEAPPETAKAVGVQSRYAAVVEMLRGSPGDWARLAPRPTKQAAKMLVNNIRMGRMSGFKPKGAYEAEYEGVNVWVRFVGDPEGTLPHEVAKNVNPSAVRRWAEATGRPVSARGRISDELVAQWYAATKGQDA